MLSRLVLPPGFTLRIAYAPDHDPLNTTVTVYRAGAWVGEVTAAAELLERSEVLQSTVDTLTNRGVRAVGAFSR